MIIFLLLTCFGLVNPASSPASFEEVGDFHHLISEAHFGVVINFTEYNVRLDILDKYIKTNVKDSKASMVRSVFSRLHAVLRETKTKLAHYEGVFASSEGVSRGKRDAGSLLSLGLSCLSLFTGWQMSSTMDDIKTRQNLFAKQLVAVTNSTVRTGKDLKKLRGAMDMVVSGQSDLRELSSLESVFLSINEEADSLFGGLDILLSGRLSPRLLHSSDVKEKFQNIISVVTSAKYRLIFPDLHQIFQLPASFYTLGGCLFALVQVPMEPVGTPEMSLYKHSQVPVFAGGHLVRIMGKSSFLAISKDNSRFVDISDAELQKCKTIGRKTLCSYPGVEFSTGVPHCLKDIFLSTLKNAVSHCSVVILKKELHLSRLNSTAFAVYSPIQAAGSLACEKSIRPLIVENFSVHNLQPGCVFTIRGLSFRAAYNPVVAPVHISSVIFHDALNLSLTNQGESALEAALDNFQEIDFQSLIQGGEEIADLDPWQDGGLSAVWITVIVLAVLVLLLLVTLVIVFKCRHAIFASFAMKSQECQAIQMTQLKDTLAEEEARLDCQARMQAAAPPSPSVSTLVRQRCQDPVLRSCERKDSNWNERQPRYNPYEYV
jgi:hypothetical protein